MSCVPRYSLDEVGSRSGNLADSVGTEEEDRRRSVVALVMLYLVRSRTLSSVVSELSRD